MEVFVARQPIFDRNKKLWGYEILYRSAGDATEASFDDPDGASFAVLHNILMVMDFKELVDNTRGFINFSRRLIVEDAASILPVERTVIEILEDTVPDDLTLKACKSLKERGYLIAVDDFTLEDQNLRIFASMADIIKVDCLKVSKEKWKQIVETYGGSGKLLLAEKIETHEDFKHALDVGFDLFQGFFFSRPATVLQKDVPAAASNVMRLMAEFFSKKEMSFEDFERILKKDPALTYKLLRYINSPAMGLRCHVTDIRRAIMLLGEKELRRWLLLVIYGQFVKGNPYKLFEHSLVRARYMELLAKETGIMKPEEAFLTGMLSTIDAILNCSMEDVLRQLPLSDVIHDALVHLKGPAGILYSMVLGHEQNRLEKVYEISKVLRLRMGRLSELYLEALRWVREIEKEE